MRMEVMKLVWQDVSVRNEVKLVSTESLLHFYIIVAKSVFSRNFITLREMVDSLEFIETLI